MALTPKQRAFVVAVMGGASNKDAAIAAGYAASSASVAGSRLAKHPEVMSALGQSGIIKIVNAPAKSKSATAGTEAATTEPAIAGFDLAKVLQHGDPRDFLLAVMNDFQSDAKLRVDAAKALMPYVHGKVADKGKKEQRQDNAEKTNGGRFGLRKPGHLKAVK